MFAQSGVGKKSRGRKTVIDTAALTDNAAAARSRFEGTDGECSWLMVSAEDEGGGGGDGFKYIVGRPHLGGLSTRPAFEFR